MEAYTTKPPDGYLKVSVEQLHRADLQLFKLMMKETRSGIKPLGGNKPVEEALKRAIDAADVRLCLQPLQGASKRKAEQLDDDSKKKGNSEVSSLKKQIENLQGQVRNLRNSSSGASPSKGKKGKGKGRGNMIRLPPQLLGMAPTTSQGEPICYDFNLKGCSKAKPGERCQKGWRLCVRWGCQKAHSQTEHESQ